MSESITPRMLEALHVLASAPKEGVTPSGFASLLWPDKEFARSNGPWGLGPDASGRHGGKMLTRLKRAGLATFSEGEGYYLARISHQGTEALKQGVTP